MTRLARCAAAVTLACSTLPVTPGRAQTLPSSDTTQRTTGADSAGRQRPATRPWYERLSLRGYAQVRYNRLLETNPNLTCPQCDRSIGGDGGIFVRRARLTLSGDVHERVSVYIQPDLATDAAETLHYLQLRDAYFDVFLDRDKELRLRIGQSKVPFGWENLQSSSNRLALDRNDPLNSAVPNERDLGAFFYWAPSHIRRRFRILVDSGLKGTGDYGVVGVGVYNGQSANQPEANDGLHRVLRVSYPFRLPSGQFVEMGVQGYDGRYVIPPTQRGADVAGPSEFVDRRAAASFIVYPQPFGIEGEWNVGRGPEFDPATRTILTRGLDGGYVQAMYRASAGGHVITPFARAQRYDGGKKAELDARRYRIREYEIGAEWLPFPAFELTAMYTISDRRYEDGADPDNRQRGRLLRLQVQFNY